MHMVKELFYSDKDYSQQEQSMWKRLAAII